MRTGSWGKISSVPTYVVIHGAGDVGASWDLVAAELRERGHRVIAPDLPCEDPAAGISAYADAVVAAVGERHSEPAAAAANGDGEQLVVVAHSLGGFTAPLVCERLGADLLVLVTAMVPLPGETAGEWWETSGFNAAAGDLDMSDETATFLHDVPERLAKLTLLSGRDQAAAAMEEPFPLDAWPDVPTRFLLARDDRFFPAAWMRDLVRERLGIEPDEIGGSHGLYLSRPAELAQRLEAMRADTAARAGG